MEKDFCIIDDTSRTIYLSSSSKVSGVESDQNIKKLYFKCPKIVCENIDLSTMVLSIKYITPLGKKGIFFINDLEVTDNFITFSWQLPEEINQRKGISKFIINAVKTHEDGRVLAEWNTSIAQLKTLSGIEIDTPTLSPEEYNEIAQIIGTAQNYANQAKEAAADSKKISTYITPEQFGAKGDGVTDDTVPLQKAIAAGKPILGNSNYKTSKPLTLGDNTRLVINGRLIYTGTDAAVIIDGSFSDISINAIQSNNIGIKFEGEKGIAYNKIKTIRMVCEGDCVYMHEAINQGIFYNFFDFAYLQSESGMCIHLKVEDVEHAFIGENTFYGGKCHHGDWAVYCDSATEYGITGVKLYNIGIEGVTNGIYFRNVKNSIISEPRYAELIQTGLAIKMAGKSTHNKLRSTNTITPSKIDYSELDASVTNRTGNLIDAVLWNSDGYIIGSKCYVCHDGLVIIPYEKLMYINISDSKPIINISYEESQYSYFLINASNNTAEVHLNSSYGTVGINEIYIQQGVENKTVKIYDNSGKLLFDGTKAGVGVFKLVCHDLGGPDTWEAIKITTISAV